MVKSCQEKMTGLWKCTAYLDKHQRKLKVEGIIISRLTYCLEVVSTGRKTELEKLQGIQSAGARWVLQTRRRDCSLSGGLKKLNWLSVVQLAVYFSLKLALRVIKEKKPERLYETLTEENGGEREIRTLTDKRFEKYESNNKEGMVCEGTEMVQADPMGYQGR